MRWGDRPVWVRCVAAAYVIGFLEGTGWHAYCLVAGGLHAYSYAPLLIQLLFHALLLLDPLVALLIVRARPGGPLLAAPVMLADLVGNWGTGWRAVLAHPAAYLRPVGLLPITLFGIFVLLTAFPLRRALTPGGDAARSPRRRRPTAERRQGQDLPL
ncbi:hypothetical protein [Streptomyces durhamensis]|uniref:hypothetical protein n=1 Tax=Streptomyces durhamensis TaxID=68194 RepID=UPI0004CD81CD|nr:hypothetical protein [Streptomyces durhamensis]